MSFLGCRSDGRRVAVAGPDPDHRLDRADPHLAVTDPAGLRGLLDDPEDVLGVTVVRDDLDPDLGHQRDVVLRAAVDLRVALLPAVAADLGDGHPGDPEGLEGLADLFPLVRLDHCGDELHARAPSVDSLLACAAVTDPVPSTPPERPSRSYADSPCSAKSMPSISSSSLIRHPMVCLMASAMRVVKTPVQTTVKRTPRVWCQSRVALPP